MDYILLPEIEQLTTINKNLKEVENGILIQPKKENIQIISEINMLLSNAINLMKTVK